MTEEQEFLSVDYEDDVELYELSILELIVWCFLYALIAILAVVGNSLVIFVTLQRLRTRAITTYFIINLALADLLTGIFAIPFKFQAALFQEWFLPRSLCQIVPFSETVSLSVSVFTLTASALHEFRTTFLPKTSTRMSSRSAQALVICIWVVAAIISLPHGLFHDVYLLTDPSDNSTIAQCRPVYASSDLWKLYNIYLTIIHYFVPMIILDTAYVMIAVKIWSAVPVQQGTAPGEQSNRKVINMLIIVVACFSLCWLPLETYLLLNEVRPEINAWKYINVFFFCSHWLAMSNSCLNPIIYGLFNEKYQREYKRVFCLRKSDEYEQKNSTGYHSVCGGRPHLLTVQIAERSWNIEDVDDLEGTPMVCPLLSPRVSPFQMSPYKNICGASMQLIESSRTIPSYL